MLFKINRRFSCVWSEAIGPLPSSKTRFRNNVLNIGASFPLLWTRQDLDPESDLKLEENLEMSKHSTKQKAFVGKPWDVSPGLYKV